LRRISANSIAWIAELCNSARGNSVSDAWHASTVTSPSWITSGCSAWEWFEK
jgi:hypothetical protein